MRWLRRIVVGFALLFCLLMTAAMTRNWVGSYQYNELGEVGRRWFVEDQTNFFVEERGWMSLSKLRNGEYRTVIAVPHAVLVLGFAAFPVVWGTMWVVRRRRRKQTRAFEVVAATNVDS